MGAMAGVGSPEAPVRFEDVIIYFFKDEWKLLEKWQKNLYWEVLTDNYEALIITGHPVTKSDILAWVEQCEHLNVKGTRESGAANGRHKETWCEEQAGPGGSLKVIQEDAGQHGHVGETEPLPLSGGKQGSPKKDEPFPHPENKAGEEAQAGPAFSQRTVAAPKRYKCGECGKRFRLEKLLQIHQKISRKKESFPCPNCGMRFLSPSHLLMHQRTHRPACAKRGKEDWQSALCGIQALEKLHPCADCGRSFSRYLDLLQHQKAHDEAKPWPCPQCGEIFMYQSELAIHEERHLEETLPGHTGCGKNCICECLLLLHFSSHGGQSGAASKHGLRGHEPLLQEASSPEEKSYSCARCGLLFKLEMNLEVHFRYCHKELPSKREFHRSPRSPLSCPREVHAEHKVNQSVLGGSQDGVCRSQPPSQTAARHTCAICGKRFGFKFKLRKHQQKHKAGKPGSVRKQGAGAGFVGSLGGPKTIYVTKKLHKCQECGDKFVYKWQLAAHLKGHVEDKVYDCSYCGKCFGSKSSLRKHHQIHRDEAARKNGTSQENFSVLAVNRRTHGLDQLYHCECGKSFARRYLPIHRAFHAGVRYKCLLCGKVCNFQGAATMHCKTHKDLSPCPKCVEMGGSRPCRCMIERICVAPGSHDSKGMSQPGSGLPPKHLCPKYGERFPSKGRHRFKQHIPAGKQESAWPESPKKPCRKSKLQPAFRTSLPKLYKCKDCGKDFAYFGRLIMHRRAHTGEYPFQCAECGRGFVHRRYLNMHWKIHTK